MIVSSAFQQQSISQCAIS